MAQTIGGRKAARASLALVALMTLLLGACSWPMFRFDAAHSGTNPESTITAANRAALTQLFTVQTAKSVFSSPAIVDGIGYVGSDDGQLYAFDANGTTRCGGNPTQCAPLWTSTPGYSVSSSPAVVNGVVYVGSDGGGLMAFDAHGVNGCSGTPKVCNPLWTSQNSLSRSSPVVANGVVYIGSVSNTIEAYDAAGNTNCSGTPKVCQPLWQGPVPGVNGAQYSSPAVANGMVYVGSRDGKLYA
jgi:outer membrane protein assembly factor BamB